MSKRIRRMADAGNMLKKILDRRESLPIKINNIKERLVLLRLLVCKSEDYTVYFNILNKILLLYIHAALVPAKNKKFH